jgi:predicted DNA-binding transcriptional regulator YafY
MSTNNKRMRITLLRQWEMLRLLTVSRSVNPNEGRWDKANEIAEKLKDRGYEITVRTVQRDLKELSNIFPIELNSKNPRDYGWRWEKGHNLNIQGIGTSEALAMRLVELQLKQQLPHTMLDSLEGVFNIARKKLDDLATHDNRKAKDWLNKIRVVQAAQTLLPPSVDEAVQSAIYEAVLENRQIAAAYTAIGNATPKDYVLHPLGIIMRGSITYLLATVKDYPTPILFALHRFQSAQLTIAAAKIPKGFSMDKSIAAGIADFAIHGEPVQLELRCSESVTNYLNETKLSEDQLITPETDGWKRVVATVNDTWQLRWWILGQGAEIEVCAPHRVRKEIYTELRNTLHLYERNKKSKK